MAEASLRLGLSPLSTLYAPEPLPTVGAAVQNRPPFAQADRMSISDPRNVVVRASERP